jgi:geranylgeranyl pyrophosphate synthase
VDRVRELYRRAGVYEQARALVAKHRQRAREIAAAIGPPPLRQLLDYLADTVLEG